MVHKELYVKSMLPMQRQVLNIGMPNNKCTSENHNILCGTVKIII